MKHGKFLNTAAIPHDRFWADVTSEEIGEMARNDSCLTPRLKERLYRMLDIQNPPEGELQILINHNELLKFLWEEYQRHPEKFKKAPPRPKGAT